MPVPAAEAPRSQEDFPTSVRPGEVPPLHPYGDDPLNTEPPPPPPPLGPPPSVARYPLFAETVAAPAVPPPVAAPVAAPWPATPAPRRRSATPWVIAFLALAAIAAVGGILLVVGGSGEKDADDPAPRTHGTGRTQEAPSQDGAEGIDGAAAAVVPADVDVPGTAPASVDTDGTRVTFDAGNMLDDDPRTCWRTPGDATGATLTFTFDEPVTLSEVGLVNGYAKTDPPHDWYHGNRRITDVVWTFDDGTEVEQHLGADDTSVQSTDVDDVQTSSVELRIVGLTAPGRGADSRDYTAISEAAFSGR
ncbi:hypothetical protein [Nocardioides sp. MH1]|uniref:NADase-type glycan-binding domain-containing protein n=1 Tax=Nocardioides sp. MH1 TaxID=3242490 RepID=UPI003522DA9B